MMEVIIILCIIWNTLWFLRSRHRGYYSPWSDYTTKLIYSKPVDWGFCQVIIIPKNQGLSRKVKKNV